MTHVNPVYAAADNRYRVAGSFVERNFVLIEIDWDASPSPTLAMKALGSDGRVDLGHEISLGDLQ
jgi:hypothetical protein